MAGHSQANAPQADAQWWVHHNGQTNGPYAAEHVIGWLSDGTMPVGTLICPNGGQEWHPVSAWPRLTSRLPAHVLAAVKEVAPTSNDIGDDPAMRMLLPVGRSPLAIVAGYLGLVSPLVIFAPFALLCGVLAIRDIRRHPHKHGMGRAVFGVMMGLVFSVLLLVIIVGIVMESI